MSEAVAVAPGSSPVHLDHKRKLADLCPETEGSGEGELDLKQLAGSNSKTDEAGNGCFAADVDLPETKRHRLDETEPQNLEQENDGDVKDVQEEAEERVVENEHDREETKAVDVEKKPTQEGGFRPQDEEEGKINVEAEGPVANTEAVDTHEASSDSKHDYNEIPWKEEPEGQYSYDQQLMFNDEIVARSMEVPNDKVGVLIGKRGETIRFLQSNSGAKIQIARNADVDSRSITRPVELVGTLRDIGKAEKLITAVIAEADAGGSPSLVARGLPGEPIIGRGDQLEIQVPNDKVGLIIGRAGETIKSLQSRSGARIQVLIPQHDRDLDGAEERTVRLTGDMKSIEMAREMLEDVMCQPSRPSHSRGFNQQQSYQSRGQMGMPHWGGGPRGNYAPRPMAHDYHQHGPYPPSSQSYLPPAYGGYPQQQMVPRGNMGGPGWDQRAPPSMQGQFPHGGSYDYYGGPGTADHRIPAPISTHAPAQTMGPATSQANYSNYPQPHGQDYGHQPGYAQTTPQQQGYGQGYDEMKQQYPQTNPQSMYSQANSQPGFGAPQQYSKQQPSYPMPTQGPHPQAYGQQMAQPGDLPYQGQMQLQLSQGYGGNAQAQPQQYPYGSSTGLVQQSYPSLQGVAATADGYVQQQTNPGSVYPAQPVAAYVQPAGQATQPGQPTATSYGSYPAQQVYPDQSAYGTAATAAAAAAAYGGYQRPQDSTYAAPVAANYGAQSQSGQQVYSQAAPAQPNYDQSLQQAGAYGAPSSTVQGNGYGKTVSPQASSYAQYDSSQMYTAPH